MFTSSDPNDLALPPPGADARRHTARVLEHICERIRSRNGWIPFSEFMSLALYAPGLGYYAAGSQKFGQSGDFVTAPELTSLFGRSLAQQLAQVLKMTSGEIIELGAGSGALAGDILRELEQLNCLPARYRILEASAELAQRQRQRIGQSIPGLVDRVEWLDALPEKVRGVVIANEVVDALPVQLLVWRDDGLFERGVSLQEGVLAWEERIADASLHALAAEISSDVVISAPYTSEVSPMASALAASLGERLEHGVVLLIDYGFGRPEYYHPQRSSGTLMCHYRHRAHADPFFLPGLQDITAHVDFSSIAGAGIDAGCSLAGFTTQAQFLLNCGITQLLAQTSAEDTAAYLPQVAAVQKLLSPAEMGELFKVLALARGIDVPLLGFAEGDRTGSL